jgi:glycosyltransferase involved in cell wall biosynthesis
MTSFNPEEFFRAAPQPLDNRVTEDVIVLIAFVDQPGQAATYAALRDELASLAPLPVRLTVISEQTDERAYLDAGIEWCPAQGKEFVRLLLQAEAALLPDTLCGARLAALSQCAVPALISRSADSGPWSGHRIGVSGATPRELAGLLLLLATDPPLRRRALGTIDEESPIYRMDGVFDSSYSLAIVNRQFAMALEYLGKHVALHTYEQGPAPQPNWGTVEEPARLQAMWALGKKPQPPMVAMRNAWPPVVRDMRAARRVLGPYGWEETSFPAQYAEDFNLTLDLVTVLSSQTERLLRDAGVRTPMAVVGAGVDHLLAVSPAPTPRALPPGFRFLHVSSCFPRKGADIMLEAFGRAFRAWDDVCLVIKTFPNPHNDVAAQLAARRATDTDYPRVELIEEDWTPSQIVGLYQACHALVAPSRAEGFGLPIAEAMIQNLPVIVTGWGGHMDFCDEDNAWLVDYTPTPAQTHLVLPDSLWAEPSAESLASRLREVLVLSPDERERKTALARRQVLARYTWRQVAERTLEALAAVERMPAPYPAPRVGWISTWGSRCGIAAYSEHLSAAFPADSITIFAPSNETPERNDPVNLVRNWTLGAGQLDEVARHARELDLDMLIVQFHWAFFSLDALAQLASAMSTAGVKVFIDIHNTKSGPSGRILANALPALAKCARILAHTLDDIRRLKRLGLSDNVTLFPLGVYPVPLPDAATLAAQREALSLGGKTVLASYGFLMPHKGLLQLLDAMPELLRTQPQLHLLMVNAYYSDTASAGELARIEQRIAALGLENSVTLKTDFLPEVESIALLAVADLVVFPYQNTEESASAAVRMALSAGLPTAVTPLPIFADVADAVDVLPGTDAQALATGLAELLRRQAQPAARAAAEARARAHAERRGSRRLSARLYRMVQGCCLKT